MSIFGRNAEMFLILCNPSFNKRSSKTFKYQVKRFISGDRHGATAAKHSASDSPVSEPSGAGTDDSNAESTA